jgi:hypothetical protein
MNRTFAPKAETGPPMGIYPVVTGHRESRGPPYPRQLDTNQSISSVTASSWFIATGAMIIAHPGKKLA